MAAVRIPDGGHSLLSPQCFVSRFLGGENVTFSVDVYKSSDPDKVVTQSITVTTVYTDLVPVIRGGSELTIGRDSGYVSIDGSSSFDPDLVAADMSYEWLCEQARYLFNET